MGRNGVSELCLVLRLEPITLTTHASDTLSCASDHLSYASDTLLVLARVMSRRHNGRIYESNMYSLDALYEHTARLLQNI